MDADTTCQVEASSLKCGRAMLEPGSGHELLTQNGAEPESLETRGRTLYQYAQDHGQYHLCRFCQDSVAERQALHPDETERERYSTIPGFF